MATYLDAILRSHRDGSFVRCCARSTPLVEAARAMGPARAFADALASVSGLGVISEVKRRSPSKGLLAADLDPAALAEAYETGGATCLSVLTDEQYFGGSAHDLQQARASCSLPVLRKDFTVDARDVCDARLMGADAVLLIAAALDDAELADFVALAAEIGIDALVEIHDEAELERAMEVDAPLIGVNQRDLVTFAVDTERAVRMAPQMPDGRRAGGGVRGARRRPTPAGWPGPGTTRCWSASRW